MTFRLVFLLTILACSQLAAEERAEDHQALRVLRTSLTTAMNEHRTADLIALLDDECSITFVDQRVVADAEGLDKAFDAWFGANGPLASVQFAPVVKRGSIFTGADTAWATGVSDDVYTLKDGRSGPMTANWTASMVRRDGVWKLSTLHAGVDPEHNPMLDMVTSAAQRWVIYALISGALGGLVLGFISARLLSRR
jgi:hypothetical protein